MPETSVAVLAFDGISPFHLSVPGLVFGEVAQLGLGDPWRVDVWAARSGSVLTADGYRIGPLPGPAAVAGADIVVIPSWREPTQRADPRIGEVLRRAHSAGATIVGLCLGAFVVAQAGLLDGRRAVTHWRAAQTLAESYPLVEVDATVLYIDHGDVVTSAGTAASLDACLHIIRSRLGSSAANQIARSLVVAPHRNGGQAQYIERPVVSGEADDPIAKALVWVEGHLNEQLPVERLAKVARMSRRNFTRLFRDATGTTPARWVVERRLDEVRTLLERTSMTLEAIASSCGFESAVTLRQNFVGRFGLTPTAYRRAFRGPAAYSAGGASDSEITPNR